MAFITSQRGVDIEQFVHEYYSVDRFRSAYVREIEPMTDRSQWPHVELPFGVGAPLAKPTRGRNRKLRIKGCLEGGHRKKRVNEDNNEWANSEPAGGSNVSAPANSKGKKMIRGPVTCKRCGEKGHRKASSKCPLNGTKKKRQVFFSSSIELLCLAEF